MFLGFYGVLQNDNQIALHGGDIQDPSPFLLQMQNKENDADFQVSMTEDTAVARRCYETLISEHCPKIKCLDGLDFSHESTLQRDRTWERMSMLGLLAGPRHINLLESDGISNPAMPSKAKMTEPPAGTE